MSRTDNLLMTYMIVKEYNKQMKKDISPYLLLNYIMKKTTVTRTTALDYISSIEKGIIVNSKQYKIAKKRLGIK